MHKPTGLFIGRFQPYHIGHDLVVKGMTKVCGKIIIGIGSSDKSRTAENPYSAQERREMIQRALQLDNIIPIFDVNFVDLPDCESDEKWTTDVLEKVGQVDQVWTGDEWVKECFNGKVAIKDIKEVPGISATQIRAMVKSGGDWQEKVPAEIAVTMRELGLDRIK
jgi:nicotinamide-nucleotide adenylyltransferase